MHHHWHLEGPLDDWKKFSQIVVSETQFVHNHEIRSLGSKFLKGTKIQKLIAFKSQPVEISKTVS